MLIFLAAEGRRKPRGAEDITSMDVQVKKFLDEFYRILDIDIQANRDAAAQEFEQALVLRATERLLSSLSPLGQASYETFMAEHPDVTPDALAAFFHATCGQERINEISRSETETLLKEYLIRMLEYATQEQKEELRRAFVQWVHTTFVLPA